MAQIDRYLSLLNDWVWSLPLLILLLGTGIYLTFILRGVQFRYLGYAFGQIYADQKKNSKGDINPYESLMTTLAGAVGTGAIVGVSTALLVGGVGALFWMWVTALFGMATKYSESLLAIKYRSVGKNGEMLGGPMEYIEKGLKLKWLALLFAFFGVVASIGTGNLVQVNSIAGAFKDISGLNPWLIGAILSILVTSIIIGGIKSIGRAAGILVPFMAILYIGSGLGILFIHLEKIPDALLKIISSAFDLKSGVGGFLGSAMLLAIQTGASKSVFSNEAGLGISSIAAASARTDNPCRQAMINMTGALISTVIICTITGLVLIVTGSLDEPNLKGVSLAMHAFRSNFPFGEYIVAIGLILFAFTTTLAWAFYGEKCFEYLFGEKYKIFYRIIFCLIVIPGAALKLETAWFLADISNGLMAIPNLIALVCLSKIIGQETKEFLKIASSEKFLIKNHL